VRGKAVIVEELIATGIVLIFANPVLSVSISTIRVYAQNIASNISRFDTADVFVSVPLEMQR
jgi:hypothetical protein